MQMTTDLSLNPSARPSLRHICEEREPLRQIDDLLHWPEALVDYAASEVAFQAGYGPGGCYPGIRATASLDHVEAVVRAIDTPLRDAFGIRRARLANAECNFSLVTLAAGSPPISSFPTAPDAEQKSGAAG